MLSAQMLSEDLGVSASVLGLQHSGPAWTWGPLGLAPSCQGSLV